MDQMKKYADGIYVREFADGSKLFMTGLPYNFRRYNVKNTNKFLKHFKMTDKPISKTRQKHTKNIIVNPHPGEYVGVDGFITEDRPVMVVTADCIPILIKDKNSKRAALLHSGWRGVKKRIYCEAINKLGRRTEMEAYLLPSIQKASFQVSEDFVKEFKGRRDFNKFLTVDEKNPGKYYFDLQKFVKAELIGAGLKAKDIYICKHDTFTSKIFHSYRREKGNYGLNAIIYIP